MQGVVAGGSNFEHWFFRNPRLQDGQPEDSLENYQYIDYIDRGGIGRVFEHSRISDGMRVAIKTINKRDIQWRERQLIKSELQNMYRIDHPNIIKLISHFEDFGTIYLVTEFCSQGNLHKFQKRQEGQRFDEKLCVFFVRQVVQAIEYLHGLNPPIIHRDIKPENILLDNQFNVKLIDFGSSKAYEQSNVTNTHTGTPIYMPPEIVSGNSQNEKVDMWLMGILIYEFLSGETPFYDRMDTENQMVKLNQNILKNEIRFPEDFPPLAKGLVISLLNANPARRPSIQKIKADPWLQQQTSEEMIDLLLRTILPTNPLEVKTKTPSKQAENISSILQLKISEMASANFRKDEREKRDSAKKEISKLADQVMQLNGEYVHQRQQIDYLIGFINIRKDLIAQKKVEIFNPYYIEQFRKEQLKQKEKQSDLEKKLLQKQMQLKKNALSIASRQKEVEDKLSSETRKFEKFIESNRNNLLKIEELKRQIAEHEKTLRNLQNETKIDLEKVSDKEVQDQMCRDSLKTFNEIDKYENQLLQGVKTFLSVDVFSVEEQELKVSITQLEDESIYRFNARIDKFRKVCSEELRDQAQLLSLELKSEKKVYESTISDLQSQYEELLTNHQNALLLKKQLDGCNDEIVVKTQLKAVLLTQQSILQEKLNLLRN